MRGNQLHPGAIALGRERNDKEMTRHLFVEIPLNLTPANIERAEKVEEEMLGSINIVDAAARALVVDDSLGRVPVGLDGNGFAAQGVAVGLGTHQGRGDGDNVFAVVLAAIVEATGAQAESEVSDLASADDLTAGSTRSVIAAVAIAIIAVTIAIIAVITVSISGRCE